MWKRREKANKLISRAKKKTQAPYGRVEETQWMKKRAV